MKTIILGVLLLSSSFSAWGESENDLLNAIGVNEKGEEVVFPIKAKRYKKRLSKTMKYFNAETGRAINKAMVEESSFELKQIDVGAYVKMKVGIGDLLKGTIEPYFKLFFKK